MLRKIGRSVTAQESIGSDYLDCQSSGNFLLMHSFNCRKIAVQATGSADCQR